MRTNLRRLLAFLTCALAIAADTRAEVTKVTIANRTVVAGGQAFGQVGPYEKLTGTIEFALDPADKHNSRVVDLEHAARAADGRVHFSADLYVLRPVEAQKGNGALLFEIANRGRKGLLGRFNRAASVSQDPMAAADFGDGFLMKDGYTLVWVGWQFDVQSPLVRIAAPAADVQGRVRYSFIVDAKQTDTSPADLPAYPPLDLNDRTASLTVRDRFWGAPTRINRDKWRFDVQNSRVHIVLGDGFEPGRLYEIDYPAGGAKVVGAGMAAIRDAASAFRYRTDLPIRGRTAYIFGASQSGRFLRQFLHDGFNVDEEDRRAFDLVWPHIAGAGQGSFNERFAAPGYNTFSATQFPFTDLAQAGPRGERDGILAAYRSNQAPKVIYTNTSVEYWGLGRSAALTHLSLDGARDADVPDNVRIYHLAGTQHGEAAFPPTPGNGQALGNPMPQGNVMRALLRAAHQWVESGTRPPDSRHPSLRDQTLVQLKAIGFPAIPGLGDPRTIEGPGHLNEGHFAALPFLVPKVDADGNEVAGIRVPELAVPLATT
ncbi:MAG TPA: alpha/beta hydrolase domain-containing protein, partial [Vicinamibacterales bacterium]|nr:alpha/beta hydrolase domain-containing protein [Vicinamibacterales bacterium]